MSTNYYVAIKITSSAHKAVNHFPAVLFTSCGALYHCVADGLFGAMMQVHIQNDGPVTITLESPVNTVSIMLLVKSESTAVLLDRTTANFHFAKFAL